MTDGTPGVFRAHCERRRIIKGSIVGAVWLDSGTAEIIGCGQRLSVNPAQCDRHTVPGNDD